MARHDTLIARASQVAERSIDNYRLGAVVAKGSNCLSFGYNRGWKTHPVQARMYPDRDYKGLHAEVDALKKIEHRDDLDSVVLYVARIKKNGDWGLARPCELCMKYISSLGIPRIVYTDDDGYVIEEVL